MTGKALACLTLAAVFLSFPACAGSLTYSAEPLEAKVIDADTKQPLEGVVVTANWQLEEGTFGGNVDVGQLMVMEAVTDKDGRFRFPAWGPKTAKQGFLVNRDPQLLFFKSGYEYQRFMNRYSPEREARLRPVRRSDWNRRIIVLKPFKGTEKEYARRLGFLSTSLETIAMSDCEWKRIPHMLLAIKAQKEIFRKSDIRESLIGADYVPTNEKRCGSPNEFFRRYQ